MVETLEVGGAYKLIDVDGYRAHNPCNRDVLRHMSNGVAVITEVDSSGDGYIDSLDGHEVFIAIAHDEYKFFDKI